MRSKGVDEFVEVVLAFGGILAGQPAECVVELLVDLRQAAESVAESKKPTHNSHTQQQQQQQNTENVVYWQTQERERMGSAM